MYRKHTVIAASVVALLFLVGSANRAAGQECPRPQHDGPTIPSKVRTLRGQLVYDEGIRGFFELKLDQPECGQTSIQLMQAEKRSPPLEVFRGCRVASRGAIDLSPTGYYTLDVFQNVEDIVSVGACTRQPPFPDYSGSKPDKTIRAYRVDMYVSNRPGDHPVILHVSSAGRELLPWQAYASYWLTGGWVLYGHCGEGFVVDEVFGTRKAKPEHFLEPRTESDMAEFDPVDAEASGKRDLHLGYTCIRKP